MTETFIYQTALRDFLRPRRMVVWGAVVLAVAGIAYLVMRLNPAANPEDTYLRFSAIIVYRVLALAAAIFSTAVLSAEVEQRTIVYLLTRPVPRWKLLLFRSFAAVTCTLIVGVACAVLVSFATFGSQGLSNEYLWRDMRGLVVGGFCYTGFFTLLSLLVNRSMIISLLYAFGWETIVTNLPGDVRVLSISNYLSLVSERPSLGAPSGASVLAGELSVNTMTASIAWPVVIGLTLFTFAFGAWWFSHHEYLAREDVE